jgi:hypothetical protein
MYFRVCMSVALMLLLLSGCSEPLDDTTCTHNDDCETGYACDPDGYCMEAADLHISVHTLMDAFIGEAYSDTITVSGGIIEDHYTWSLALADLGETRLNWIEIAPATGEIRNKAGEFPTEMGRRLGIMVTVRDASNRGEGQETSAKFELDILQCRGDKTCWEYAEDQGQWGCRQGIEACTDGVLSGQCVLSGWSTSIDHCGDGCGLCDTGKTDRCVQGNCVCGQTGGSCPPGEFCCSGDCTDHRDLNHCGACDTPCQPQNVASASCDQGACTYDQCSAGFYDCDTNEANGCETASGLDNCSACGDACPDQVLYPNTTGHSCPAGICLYQCALGYADCDAGSAGCETTLGTLLDCSDCGDACVDSAAGGKVCIDEGGAWRCGCTSEADCDGDDMCCTQTCTPHDTDHCADCDTGCTIATGGPGCDEVGGGVYECRCGIHEDCRGDFGFSEARCSPSTYKCFCQGSVNCAGTVDDMCCIVSAVNECVDLNVNAENCGICGAVCSASETCTDGACSCSGGTCPVPSGAPDCLFGGVCGCNFFGGDPCHSGQYCCDNEGCCLAACGTANNECSIACVNANDIWCDWGCCTTCQSEADCPTAIQ